jgi:two-component system cell cycle response regulator DivK
MRILVADDDRQFSTLACQMLMAAGHQAFPAFDGASALMAAMRTPAPDLIVLDLQMPAGDGTTTLTKLKQSSKTALIPVVVVSATTDTAMHDKVRTMGAAGFLAKPINPDTFIDAVEAFGPPAKR